MKNTLQPNYYYQLAFKNNLQLVELNNEVAVMGNTNDFRKWKEELLDKELEDYDENSGD